MQRSSRQKPPSYPAAFTPDINKFNPTNNAKEMITPQFIEAANAAAAKVGFINPNFVAARNGENAYTFRSFYDFKDTSRKGETLKVEISTGEDSGTKYSTPRLWYNAGNTPTILRRYWCITTYVTDAEGDCWGIYNPQHTKGGKIDFAYMLEATPENLTAILRECVKRFNAAN